MKSQILTLLLVGTIPAILAVSLDVDIEGCGAEDFSYLKGGADWEGDCAEGHHQSPIDIPINPRSPSPNRGALEFNDNIDFKEHIDELGEVLVEDRGVTLWASLAGKGALTWFDVNGNPDNYDALQFHFHAPSEHTFNGHHYDLEMHIVHKNNDSGKLAVLAVFFDVAHGGDEHNELIASIKPDDSNPTVDAVPLGQLVDRLRHTYLYNYQGSLTTPPCSEIVNWIVTHDVQPISAHQLEAFNKRWLEKEEEFGGNGNNRHVQPLNDRTIYKRRV